MQFSGTTLLSLFVAGTAMLGCARDGDYFSPNGDRADMVADGDAPILSQSYGTVVTSSILICKRSESPCPEGKDAKIAMSFSGIMRYQQQGANVHGSFHGCNLDFSLDGEDMEISDYLEVNELGELLKFDGLFVDVGNGPVLQSGLAALILGAKLDDDVGEDMPTDEDDVRAFDQDRDGRPGISIPAPIGRVYVGSRAILDMELTQTENGSLIGPLHGHDFELLVYDDTIPFVNVRKKLRDKIKNYRVLEQEHLVEMTPEISDCATLKAALETPVTPPVTAPE